MTDGADPSREELVRRFKQEPDSDAALALAAIAARAVDLREQQRFVLEAARLRRFDERLSAAMEQAKLAVFALPESRGESIDVTVNGEPRPLHDGPGVEDVAARKATALVVAGHAGAVRLGRIARPEPAERWVSGTFLGLKICGDTAELWRSGERNSPRLPEGVFCWDWIESGDGILACGARLGWPWLGRKGAGSEIETLELATERLCHATGSQPGTGEPPSGARRLIRCAGRLAVLPFADARWSAMAFQLGPASEVLDTEPVHLGTGCGGWRDALHGNILATLDSPRTVSLHSFEDDPSGLHVRRAVEIQVPHGQAGIHNLSLGAGLLTLSRDDHIVWADLAELERAARDSGRVSLEVTPGSPFHRLAIADAEDFPGSTWLFGDASDPGIVAKVYERHPTFSGTVLEIRSFRGGEER